MWDCRALGMLPEFLLVRAMGFCSHAGNAHPSLLNIHHRERLLLALGGLYLLACELFVRSIKITWVVGEKPSREYTACQQCRAQLLIKTFLFSLFLPLPAITKPPLLSLSLSVSLHPSLKFQLFMELSLVT